MWLSEYHYDSSLADPATVTLCARTWRCCRHRRAQLPCRVKIYPAWNIKVIIVNRISNNKELDKEIIKKIFSIRMVNLENINIEIKAGLEIIRSRFCYLFNCDGFQRLIFFNVQQRIDCIKWGHQWYVLRDCTLADLKAKWILFIIMAHGVDNKVDLPGF